MATVITPDKIYENQKPENVNGKLYTVTMKYMTRDQVHPYLIGVNAVEAWIWDMPWDGGTVRVMSYVKEEPTEEEFQTKFVISGGEILEISKFQNTDQSIPF